MWCIATDVFVKLKWVGAYLQTVRTSALYEIEYTVHVIQSEYMFTKRDICKSENIMQVIIEYIIL